MNNSSMVDSHYSAPVSQAVIIADISLLTTSFLAGTFGNGRVCILYWKNKGPPKAPQVLFANLSVIGFLSSIVCIFGWLLLVVMNYIVKFTVPVVLCFLIVPFAFALVILNAICLTLMAISRQDCVLRPFNQRITQQNVKKVIFFSWFLVLALTLAFLFFEIFAKESVCHNFKPYDLLNKLSSSNSFILYFIATSTSFNVAALLTIVITFLRTVRKLRSSIIPPSGSVQNRTEMLIRKFTYRVSAVFAICWLIGMIPNVLFRFGEFQFDRIKEAHALMVTVSKFMYALNPYLHQRMLNVRSTVIR